MVWAGAQLCSGCFATLTSGHSKELRRGGKQAILGACPDFETGRHRCACGGSRVAGSALGWTKPIVLLGDGDNYLEHRVMLMVLLEDAA